ncbi:MAG: LysM peptidoglycan-binding domain-containing protein [Candidatus Omnitrophota bacterium]|nr:LysM peptidoglycan-binding domain-containing protein [Candidatus Omnitrophota bacterium]
MNNKQLLLTGTVSLAMLVSGCIVRTYPLTKDRIDQDLSAGNRGYLKGSGSIEEAKERKATRTTQVIEVELRAPIKFERMPQPKAAPALPVDTEAVPSAEGNRGYLTRTEGAEMAAPVFESYTVQKNDTLQKISRKFYGTTKKWNKIYQANTDVLKAANKVYPGQTLKIPSEPKEALKEPKENLK